MGRGEDRGRQSLAIAAFRPDPPSATGAAGREGPNQHSRSDPIPFEGRRRSPTARLPDYITTFDLVSPDGCPPTELTLPDVLETPVNTTKPIRSALAGLPHWQQAIFAVACAEHVAPGCRRLAAASSVLVYEEAIEAAWHAALTGVPPSRDWIGVLAGLPESAVEDPYRKDYFAMRALDILRFAFKVIGEHANPEPTDLACCGAVDIYGDFDGLAAGWPTGTIDPSNLPAPGPLESHEIVAQSGTIDLLMGATAANAELCARIRAHARMASEQLDAVIPEFLDHGYYRRGTAS